MFVDVFICVSAVVMAVLVTCSHPRFSSSRLEFIEHRKVIPNEDLPVTLSDGSVMSFVPADEMPEQMTFNEARSDEWVHGTFSYPLSEAHKKSP